MLRNSKSFLHRCAYFLSIFLPLGFLWGKLHSRNYHPDLNGIKSRILEEKQSPEISLFKRWSDQLGHELDIHGKTVLEIGHGGAWYLAQALDAGASSVSGYEISANLNERAARALSELGYTKFDLLKGNGKDLEILKPRKFDLIFSITVLQHLPTRTTKRYLKGVHDLLKEDGFFVVQTLHSSTKSKKRLSVADLFSVAYSKPEFGKLLEQAGLRQIRYAEQNYGSEETFWGIYLLSK